MIPSSTVVLVICKDDDWVSMAEKEANEITFHNEPRPQFPLEVSEAQCEWHPPTPYPHHIAVKMCHTSWVCQGRKQSAQHTFSRKVFEFTAFLPMADALQPK